MSTHHVPPSPGSEPHGQAPPPGLGAPPGPPPLHSGGTPPHGGLHPPPPGGQRSSGKLGLVAGVVVVLLVLGGFGWFLVGSRDAGAVQSNPVSPTSDNGGGEDPEPGPDPEPVPAPEPQPAPDPPPETGSLADIVPATLNSVNGPYEAVEASGDPFLNANTIDGLLVTYLGPNGEETALAVGLLPDDGAARATAEDAVDFFIDDGFEIIEVVETAVGAFYALEVVTPAGEFVNAIVWTNGPLTAFTLGLFPGPVDVYLDLPF